MSGRRTAPSLLATSDLHVSHKGNRPVLERIRPRSEGDWLIVAGDVAETVEMLEWALRRLRERFAEVIWVPGNHELWTTGGDEVRLRGEARYHHLVRVCRDLGVLTPEDPYPVWETGEGPVTVAPLFVLYDYSFRPPGVSVEEALRRARAARVVCTDEALLFPDPYPDRQSWCHQRVELTRARLDAVPADHRTVLVSHWPLHRKPTVRLRHQEFALWCGTERTADWHLRYRALAEVHGHLHIPVSDHVDGVRFEEVSLGYPREWRRRTETPEPVHSIIEAAGERTFDDFVRAHR